jgi:hypothetical protein
MPYKNKEDLYKYQIKRWIGIKIKAVEYLGNSCQHCKNSFPYPAMQFHHRDPGSKEVMWDKLRLRSWDKVVTELDKCLLLCANCHAIEHSNFGAGNRTRTDMLN